MIVVLGAAGYIGRAFVSELKARGLEHRAVSRLECDYARFGELTAFLRKTGARFLVNTAGFTGKPNVDACETARDATLLGNVVLPQTIACACEAVDIPWFHVSSGCIYNGAWLNDSDGRRIVEDLSAPEAREALAARPGDVQGFVEDDEPNFSFDCPPCSFYSGSKALAEKVLAGVGNVYVGRLRIPFDEFDGPRNYLSKLLRYPKVYDNVNSLSHRGDFVQAALGLLLNRAPFGVYNMTNPGFVSTREVVERIRANLAPERQFEFWENDEAFYREAAKAPRSNCILDTAKLQAAGVAMRPFDVALDAALDNWQWEEGRP